MNKQPKPPNGTDVRGLPPRPRTRLIWHLDCDLMVPISPIVLFIPFALAAGVGWLAGFLAAGARGTNSFSTVTIRSACVYAALGVVGLLCGIALSYGFATYTNMFPYSLAMAWWGLAALLPVVWELSRSLPDVHDGGGRRKHPA